MSGRHTGVYLARELEALLKSFGIEKKVRPPFCHACAGPYLYSGEILSITCDNASNNDAMIEAINLEGFRGAESRIRCFPHILNLAVKVSCSRGDPFLLLTGTKAVLSQFAGQLKDDEASSTPAPKPKKSRTVAKTSARRARRTAAIADSDLSDEDDFNEDGSPDEDSDTGADDFDPSALDQDEDVIRAAEETQEEDLIEAARSAELEVTVTDSEQTVASTALSKVSPVVYPFGCCRHWSMY